jgi:hypothetical protein
MPIKVSMKKNKFLLVLSFLLTLCTGFNYLFAEEEVKYNPYELDKLLHEIEKPGAPVITEDYIIFTADPKSRYVGIAFDFENYQIVHPYTLLTVTDEDGNVSARHLFYCYERKHKIKEIRYRLVIDGLWTADPLNPEKVYDDNVNLYFSKVSAPGYVKRATEVNENNVIHFIYKGESGQEVRLAGNFSNWDSWIYELRETEPGIYELDLPLPDGTYYYNYYIGLRTLTDNTNPDVVFTKDGREVSKIVVH